MSQEQDLGLALLTQLRTIRAKQDGKIDISDIGKVIESLVSTLQANAHAHDNAIYNELKEMAEHILQLKSDLANLAPHNVSSEHISPATDELDAVVKATEEATNSILNCVDAIGEAVKAADAPTKKEVTTQTMKICEACSFQDITGQRISKVVSTLHYLETHITNLARFVHGDDAAANGGNGAAAVPKHKQDPLLGGPQLPTAAPTQEEIDAMFKNLG